MSFKAGQRVRMLVSCEAEEYTYPPGVVGLIDQVDERGIHHVVVGSGEHAVTLYFDGGRQAEAAMQPLDEPVLRAVPVAFSSIVGASIMLVAADGHCVGQLGIHGVKGGRAEQEAMRDRIVEALNYMAGERRIHHPKRGGDYAVLAGEALFQVSAPSMGDGKTPFKPRCRMVTDGSKVTVYHGHAGTFVRFPDEIVSPRFEEIKK